MRLNKLKRVLFLLLAAALLSISVAAVAQQDGKPVIGISWAYDEQAEEYAYYEAIIAQAGGVPVQLPQIMSSLVLYDEQDDVLPECLEASGMLKLEYAEGVKANDFSTTNVAEAMTGIDGVFFTGGEDISPTLYAVAMTEENEGEAINATRDISDYTLMAYCIAEDIPVFAVCRGEQMMGIVSGCTFTQDIPNYYASMGVVYQDTHRMPPEAENRDYERHDVELLGTDSRLYEIVGAPSLSSVSSWHHQCIAGVEGTNLTVTARTIADGVEIIEGIERADKTFCVGVQFHPENDCGWVLVDNEPEKALCDYDICLNFFNTLIRYASEEG